MPVAELERFALKARAASRLRGEVAVLITSNREIQKLNRDFRGKDKPTDVLSFPAEEKELAGDIAISLDIARQQAKRLGHAVATELKILILHGMLHLAGHDHEADSGEMARLEAKLRAKLGLTHGLIERSAMSSRSKSPRKPSKKSATPAAKKSARRTTR